jgi:hypothetical protein
MQQLLSLLFWMLVVALALFVFTAWGIGLVWTLNDVLAAGLRDIGLHGWALIVIPILIAVAVGGIALRVLKGVRLIAVLTIVAVWLFCVVLPLVAPRLAEGMGL